VEHPPDIKNTKLKELSVTTVHIMRSKIKLVVSCAACFILALNSSFSPTKLFRRRFNLYISDVRRLHYTVYTRHERLYDLSCPVSTSKWIGIGPSPVEANLYAVESGVLPIVHGAFKGKVHRKIVLVGDSVIRQVFMSMSCLTRTLGIWKDDDAYTAAWNSKNVQKRVFNDARLMLKNGLGELFFSPTAGKVNFYGWSGEQDAMEGNEDWLKSCHERKPFYLDTLSYHAQNKQAFFSPNDDTFDKVALNEEDVVFLNAGNHHSSTSKNKINLVKLLNCMQDAREQGFHVNWPQLYYVRGNVPHFNSINGVYNAAESHKPCSERVDAQANPQFIEDKKIFTGKLPLVGFDTDFSEVGSFHVGERGNSRADCSHWTMPGVPDVFARDIAKELLKLNELN